MTTPAARTNPRVLAALPVRSGLTRDIYALGAGLPSSARAGKYRNRSSLRHQKPGPDVRNLLPRLTRRERPARRPFLIPHDNVRHSLNPRRSDGNQAGETGGLFLPWRRPGCFRVARRTRRILQVACRIERKEHSLKGAHHSHSCINIHHESWQMIHGLLVSVCIRRGSSPMHGNLN